MSDLMPTNIEAEEAILGGILIDPEAISRIAELLRPEFFAITAHQVIYRSALGLFFQGQPTDLMTVTTWLTDRNQLEQVGGLTKLAQLVDRTVSAVNIDQYAVLVEDKYQRRKLIEAGNNIVQLGYETATPLETVLDRAEQEIFSITQERPQQDLVSIGETLNQTFQDLENRNEGLTLPGIPCGFYDLDAHDRRLSAIGFNHRCGEAGDGQNGFLYQHRPPHRRRTAKIAGCRFQLRNVERTASAAYPVQRSQNRK
jgi:replicative DNA helicase